MMSSDIAGKLLLIVFFLLCSAYFSATETAFSSLSKTRVRAMAERGNRRAELVLSLAERYDDLLSTILVGNNIVNIAIASVGTILFVRRFGEDLGSSLSTVVVTVVVLFFGEVTPKSLAKESPEKMAMRSAPLLRVLLIILTPVNRIFSAWKALLSRVFQVGEDRKLTQEELLLLVDEVERDGGIDSQERELVRNAIEFNDLTAEDILTPRVSIVGVEAASDRTTAAELFDTSGYSRLPVYEGTIDHIVGVLHLKDLYAPENRDAAVRELMKPVLNAAPATPIGALLRRLQRAKMHIAVVADEHGGTLGIVTMEDILEELVGEIWDEHDEIEESICRLDDGRYRLSGDLSPQKAFSLFHLREETDSSTVSGWLMEMLGRVPAAADQVTVQDVTFTVEGTELNRVTSVLAERCCADAAQPGA